MTRGRHKPPMVVTNPKPTMADESWCMVGIATKNKMHMVIVYKTPLGQPG